jgi:N-acetylmuramoyl-L-alanine amidase
MLTIVYYFFQVMLCSGMMMGYYWLVLRNKRFHQYNRFYLLAIALLSWIVPLIKISWHQPVIMSSGNQQVIQFLSIVAENNSQIEQSISGKGFEWNWNILATVIYFGIATVLLFGLLRAFARLYRMLKEHSCKNVGDVYLILTRVKGTPFSFFKYIFWNEEIDIHSQSGKQMLQHELTHVRQKHSFDKLFIQIMLVVGWFNPFFWLLRKEMEMIHEFIADKKAVGNGDTASLAQMLLTAAYPQQQFKLTHPFFFSPIKRRLQMLTDHKNPRFSYIRRLVVLPLLAIIIILFAFRNKKQGENATLSVASLVENMAGVISNKVSSGNNAGIDIVSSKRNTHVKPFNSVIPATTYTVMIDAGHGGTDKGNIGIDGTSESELTLSLAKAIRDLAIDKNIRVILTREEDEFHSVTHIAGIADKYRPDLFVSLHCNTMSEESNNISSEFKIGLFISPEECSPDFTNSTVFANRLMNALSGMQTNEPKNGYQKKPRVRLGVQSDPVLQTIKCPAVRIVTGCMNDKTNLQELKDAFYQKQMAVSVLRGINNYLNSVLTNGKTSATDQTR